MIRFDPAKLTVEIVWLKTITTAVGGSISVLDEQKSTDKKEVLRRIVVPMAVARQFLQKTKKVTKYLKPVLAAITRYDGLVVSMERHPLAGLGKLEEEGAFGEVRRWEPYSQQNFDAYVYGMTKATNRAWYFDGRYVYAFDNIDTDVNVRDGQYLTRDGRFRKLVVTTVDLQSLPYSDGLQPESRTCLAFVASNGKYAISPPIWKDVANVGATRIVVGEDDDDSSEEIAANGQNDNTYNFDAVDEQLSVNVNFALKAGQEIGKTFGYEYIEPLQLPRLMIELHTVNLPGIPKEVKHTYGCGLKFTHALAWLLGMSRQANTMQTMLMMRSLMKYLTKRGMFSAKTFDASNVFKPGVTLEDVKVRSLDDIRGNQDTAQLMISSMLAETTRAQKARKKADTSQVGGLLNED